MPGPQSGYNAEEHPRAAREMASRWLPLHKMAEVLGISPATLDRWISEHPELKAAIALGKMDADDNVERSLYERATGYSHPSEKIVVVSGGPGEGSTIERVAITERYAPDPAALKLWLTNRKSKDWAEKVDHQHAGSVRLMIDTGVPRTPDPDAS